MNFIEKIEYCMELENLEKIKEEIISLKKYFESDEYLSRLSKEKLEVLKKAKGYKDQFDIQFERSQFSIKKGMACGPCQNLIGNSEICIVDDGKKLYVSAYFIDEVPEELCLFVNEGASDWSLYFNEKLQPEEENFSDEEKKLLNINELEYFSSDDTIWINTEYDVLFTVAIFKLIEALLKYEPEGYPLDSETLSKRFFTSILWLRNFLTKEDAENIYDTISMY